MNFETLEKANDLNRKIKEFTGALSCLEWHPDPEDDSLKYSTKPRLIIDFDGGNGREQVALQMALSDELVAFLKAQITQGRLAAIMEFNEL